MQLAHKASVWDDVNNVEVEQLLDSVYVTAASTDGGQSFSIRTVNRDVDGDGDIDADDKARLLALAKAYAAIVNP